MTHLVAYIVSPCFWNAFLKSQLWNFSMKVMTPEEEVAFRMKGVPNLGYEEDSSSVSDYEPLPEPTLSKRFVLHFGRVHSFIYHGLFGSKIRLISKT